ncbi:uncharacterized protein LOC9656675 [Selaginella moellendorffii]|nr:uncharacterized protein LOC9656675 [Selaginella moellendorffii]|eukprot:XP_002973886.2 uncharacterized protein LOC9656675 [Selaginella moellendorffii]
MAGANFSAGREHTIDSCLLAAEFQGKARKPVAARSFKVTAGLTCLQFVFAAYATFLLYFMIPSAMDLPRSAWSSKLTKKFFPEQQLGGGTEDLKKSLCVYEEISFAQKVSNDTNLVRIKTQLYEEIVAFQNSTRGCETLSELMILPSSSSRTRPKVTVILNHFKRRTLCSQLDSLLRQTLPFHSLWVLAFGSPNESHLRSTVEAYNDSRIHFMTSTYDFKYFGRFQLALQAEGANFVYILDDDMIPGKKVLEIFSYIAGTVRYHNSLLGSIGRILPFRQKDFSFPSYRKPGSKEAGLYIPDPAYRIIVDRILQVDFLSSSWFLPANLVKALFLESPLTFSTGEDLHLSYQLQKYLGVHSYVVPIDPDDRDTWGDSEHRLAYVSETTVIHKDIVQLRDRQWWSALTRGYVTQWAAMFPQQCDVFFYAHSLGEILDLAPLILRFRSIPGKKAYVVVSGGPYCPCEEAALMLGWSSNSCHDRRFKMFDLDISFVSSGNSNTQVFHEVLAAMKGLIRIHSPAIIISVADLVPDVRDAIALAAFQANTTVLQLPRRAIEHALWIADVKTSALQQWNTMRISISIITQNRPRSLKRLLGALASAYYVGDEIHLTFSIDSAVDAETLKIVHSFEWPHGEVTIRRRIIQGGLIRAVSESWYPASDDDFGLLLEDDIEVSPFYFMWLKYAVLVYHYSTAEVAELNSISLYTPRVVEVVKERPRWNATDFFKAIYPNTPYLHQLPCSWGALFFPRHWREFYHYMGTRYTADAKQNPVQIPRSRTNGWQASWKKFLIDMMYLRGYVTLYPNFPNQTSFSTNHMEPGAHINSSDNVVEHKRSDFEVPLMTDDFWKLLPLQRLPSASKLPVINLFNQVASLKGLKAAGASLRQDVLPCNITETVVVDFVTGEPDKCVAF